MEHGDTNNGGARSLQFYCRDCDMVFEAFPDGSGYEQTTCSVCGGSCLTVEFEQQEKQRNAAEAAFASLLDGFLIGGVPRLGRRTIRAWQKHLPDGNLSPVTVTRYATRADAEDDVRILNERGIPAIVAGEDATRTDLDRPDRLPPIELQVPARMAYQALQILQALDPPEAATPPVPAPDVDVVFPCGECGRLITFPSDRRGKVEECPYCQEYVDVPDRSRLSHGGQAIAADEWAIRCPACCQATTGLEVCGANVGFCERCNSVWIAAEEIRRIGPLDYRWDPSDAVRSTTLPMDLALTCPECNQSSLACIVHDGHELNVCIDCHGVYADRAVLESLSRNSSSTGGAFSLESAGLALDMFASVFEVLGAIASHL